MEAEEKILQLLLGDFGGLWRILFFNFWKEKIYIMYI